MTNRCQKSTAALPESSSRSVTLGKAPNSFEKSHSSTVTFSVSGRFEGIPILPIPGPKIAFLVPDLLFERFDAHGLFRLQRDHSPGPECSRSHATLFGRYLRQS